MKYLLFILLLSIVTLNAKADTGKQAYAPTDKERLVNFPWLGLTPLNEVTRKINTALVTALDFSGEATGKISVERIFSSDWFYTNVGGKNYVVDATGQYWLSDRGADFFQFSRDAHKVNITNNVRTQLIAFMGLVKSSKEQLVYYKSTAKNGNKEGKTLYVFMDLGCPHCKRLHITRRSDYLYMGYDIVYIPFLKNLRDKKVRALTNYVFCQPEQMARKNALDNIYMNGVKKSYTAEMVTEPCANIIQQAILPTLLNSGNVFSLKGSPMIMTDAGRVFYGSSSFERSIK